MGAELVMSSRSLEQSAKLPVCPYSVPHSARRQAGQDHESKQLAKPRSTTPEKLSVSLGAEAAAESLSFRARPGTAVSARRVAIPKSLVSTALCVV